MIGGDRRLSALFALLDRVDGEDVARVQEAIRDRYRELEHAAAVDATKRFWRPPEHDAAPGDRTLRSARFISPRGVR